jgi:hypothetical protein
MQKGLARAAVLSGPESRCPVSKPAWDIDMLHMILGSIVPVFFVMALGYLAGWTRDSRCPEKRHLSPLQRWPRQAMA